MEVWRRGGAWMKPSVWCVEERVWRCVSNAVCGGAEMWTCVECGRVWRCMEDSVCGRVRRCMEK
eukprot:247104-Chlamydomonas_euryale.AAC.1